MDFPTLIYALRAQFGDPEDESFSWDDAAAVLVKRYKGNEVEKRSALQLTDSERTPSPQSKTDGFFPTLTVNEVFKRERLRLRARVWLGNLLNMTESGHKPVLFEDATFSVRRRPPLNEGHNPSVQITDLPANLRDTLVEGDVFVFVRLRGREEFFLFGLRANEAGAMQIETTSHELWVSPDTAKLEREVSFDLNPPGVSTDLNLRLPPAFGGLASRLARTQNLILEGVPGTGKSHEIILISKSGFTQPITTIVMHPAIGYEDMIEGVRPTAGGFQSGANLNSKSGANWFYECFGEDATRTPSGSEPPFGIRAGQFLLACAKACKRPDGQFLVVLDEINRCNVPRAFGELLLSIESSKRWHWNEGAKKWEGDSPSVTLPYSGLQFFVPDNLYILGTMNTSDRSVAPLDQALRRRFSFHRLEPMSPGDLKQALGDFGTSPLVGGAIDCWYALNKRLEAELGADMMLGHSYFFDAKRLKAHGGDDGEALRSTWRYSLLPQLFEILNSASRVELALPDDLPRHLETLGLEIKIPQAVGMHAMLRVNERPRANGAK